MINIARNENKNVDCWIITDKMILWSTVIEKKVHNTSTNTYLDLFELILISTWL